MNFSAIGPKTSVLFWVGGVFERAAAYTAANTNRILVTGLPNAQGCLNGNTLETRLFASGCWDLCPGRWRVSQLAPPTGQAGTCGLNCQLMTRWKHYLVGQPGSLKEREGARECQLGHSDADTAEPDCFVLFAPVSKAPCRIFCGMPVCVATSPNFNSAQQ